MQQQREQKNSTTERTKCVLN